MFLKTCYESNLKPLCYYLKRFNKYTNMSAFIQKINPMTGANDWIIQNEDYDYHQEVARAAFADMLHDDERNIMYEKALKIAIEHMHEQGKKANVLDIGTGTGLLSMMAVRHGADSVVACEAFDAMGRCALDVIKLNGCMDKIKVIPKRSTDLKLGEDLLCKANILVTEVFDTELIGEGALGTFKHAHEVLLEKDCIVIPHSATIYAQIVQSPLITNWNRIKDIYNDEGELLLKVPSLVVSCKGTAELHDVQLNQLPMELIKVLSNPRPVFRFDWSGKTPFVYKRSTIDTIKAEHDGRAQAVFMWWDLNMDINNTIVLSCAPYWAHHSRAGKGKVPWRDHWMQAVYYLPNEIKLRKGEEVHLVSCHDEYSLWFNMKNDLNVTPEDYNCPKCECNIHLAYTRTRIGMFNDSCRIKKYLSLIENQVKEDSNVLILSQGFYTALAAAKKAKQVYYFENNQSSHRVIKTFIEENNLSNINIITDVGSFKSNEKIDIVIGEPYFSSSILPWDNLLMLYILKSLHNALAEDVKIFPQRAVIKGVAVQFDDLHKIRMPLGKCRDFKMDPFDKLIESSMQISDASVEAQPLWEYPGKALTKPEVIACIDFKSPFEDFVTEKEDSFLIDRGVCNGFVLWMDWIFDLENTSKSAVTTGPTKPFEIGDYITWDMHTRQGVCLLGHRNIGKRLDYKFKFNFNKGTLSFNVI